MNPSEPEFAELTPELHERLDSFRREHAGDPVGTTGEVLWDDDQIRVRETKLLPGEYTELHDHPHDYIIVQLAGDKIAGVRTNGDHFVINVPPEGNIARAPKGTAGWAINIGRVCYHELLIELKES